MVDLRPAVPSDFERLVQFWLELREYNVGLGQRRPKRWSTGHETFARSFISEALAQASVNHVVLAVDAEGEEVGVCHTSLMGEGEPCPAHVHVLIVDEAWRGQGIGRALLDDAFAWCARVGADEASLRVAAPAVDSRRFYQRYGMQEVSTLLIKRVDEEDRQPRA